MRGNANDDFLREMQDTTVVAEILGVRLQERWVFGLELTNVLIEDWTRRREDPCGTALAGIEARSLAGSSPVVR